jgi:hypothetical protein
VSTALAIGATSRVLASIIDDEVAAAKLTLPGILGSATTSSSPPDHVVTGPQNETSCINLFLYHVTYNQGWKNVDLPTRGSNGAVRGRAPLAIDLHYLLTAYGAGDFEAQIMLGIGMQAMHEAQVLFRKKITQVFATPFANDVDKALATAALEDQIEICKIAPQQLGTEELSKLWTAFQSKFRVSAAYSVSVLLIESKVPNNAALPVLKRSITAIPFQPPAIESIEPQVVPWNAAPKITLTGQGLPGANTFVQFDSNPDALQLPDVVGGGAQLVVPVPVLPAGINTLRVLRLVDVGTPPLRPAAQSNVGVFVLQPAIRRAATPPHDYLITTGAPTARGTPISVTLDPVVGPAQRASVLLNFDPPGASRSALVFDAEPHADAPTNTITAFVRDVPKGNFLLRARIDGADSALDVDAGTHAFSGPLVKNL